MKNHIYIGLLILSISSVYSEGHFGDGITPYFTTIGRIGVTDYYIELPHHINHPSVSGNFVYYPTRNDFLLEINKEYWHIENTKFTDKYWENISKIPVNFNDSSFPTFLCEIHAFGYDKNFHILRAIYYINDISQSDFQNTNIHNTYESMILNTNIVWNIFSINDSKYAEAIIEEDNKYIHIVICVQGRESGMEIDMTVDLVNVFSTMAKYNDGTFELRNDILLLKADRF